MRPALAVAALAFALAVGAPPAAAVVSDTEHAFPAADVAGVERLCGPSPAYACAAGGYAGQTDGWWGAKYGALTATSNEHGVHSDPLYAAYRIGHNGVGDPGWGARGFRWDDRAAEAGTPVDQTPAVGAVAQWNGGEAGHVAYVDLAGDGFVEVTADRSGANETNRWRIAADSPAWPDNFIHFHDVLAEGAFVSDSSDGLAYVIAGGAPIHVWDWSALGGERPAAPLTHEEIEALPDAPRDGTVVEGRPSGRFWSFTGGRRAPAEPADDAIGVDDAGLAPFPLVEDEPQPPPGDPSGPPAGDPPPVTVPEPGGTVTPRPTMRPRSVRARVRIKLAARRSRAFVVRVMRRQEAVAERIVRGRQAVVVTLPRSGRYTIVVLRRGDRLAAAAFRAVPGELRRVRLRVRRQSA